MDPFPGGEGPTASPAGKRLTSAARRAKLSPLGAARLPCAQVAQLVEHVTENHGVGGSIPSLGTIFKPFALNDLERSQRPDTFGAQSLRVSNTSAPQHPVFSLGRSSELAAFCRRRAELADQEGRFVWVRGTLPVLGEQLLDADPSTGMEEALALPG